MLVIPWLAFFVLSGWNLIVTYDAIERSHHALKLAEQKDPDFYSASRAHNDYVTHGNRHKRETANWRQDIRQRIDLLNQQLLNKIEKIAIKPRELPTLCEELSDRAVRM